MPAVTLRWQRGRVDYVTDGIGVQGREWFDVTIQADGQRTIRAHCEIEDGGILRDVVYTVDRAWKPLDCFVRLSQHGRFVGSAWFRFDERGGDCEAQIAELGRISQRWDMKVWPSIFASHSVVTDVWQMALFDHSRTERVQTFRDRISSSAMHNGGSGPLIGHGYSGDGRPGEIDLEYVGEERVTVPAGTWDTRHYRIQRLNRPPLEIWGSGPDVIPVQLRWEVTKRTYVLAEFSASA